MIRIAAFKTPSKGEKELKTRIPSIQLPLPLGEGRGEGISLKFPPHPCLLPRGEKE
jgi:hypothetical protein